MISVFHFRHRLNNSTSSTCSLTISTSHTRLEQQWSPWHWSITLLVGCIHQATRSSYNEWWMSARNQPHFQSSFGTFVHSHREVFLKMSLLIILFAFLSITGHCQRVRETRTSETASLSYGNDYYESVFTVVSRLLWMNDSDLSMQPNSTPWQFPVHYSTLQIWHRLYWLWKYLKR